MDDIDIVDTTDKSADADNPLSNLATLNARQLSFLSHTYHDIRTTVSHLALPDVSALSVLNSVAIDSLKDLYYALNTEDPLNAMPIRRHVLSNSLPVDALLPIAVAATADPASKRNQKRWALPTYQTLRLLSVLTLPISPDSDLPAPAQLDYSLLSLRVVLAERRDALRAFVSLFHYYLDRKAQKRASFAPAEHAKLEDARIDNILRFFHNILTPPRSQLPDHVATHDRQIHTALVGSLVSVEFFSTLAVLFASPEDARSHYTDLVFLVADIYAMAYRHSSPRKLFLVHSQNSSSKSAALTVTPQPNHDPAAHPQKTSDTAGDTAPSDVAPSGPLVIPKPPARRSINLRDALLRERATIGGSRAITANARWTTRHSGGFISTACTQSSSTARNPSSRIPNGIATPTMSRNILDAKGAIHNSKLFNPRHDLQESIRINSELLCFYGLKGRSSANKNIKTQSLPSVRRDLQDDGWTGLVRVTSELLEVSFQSFIRELRDRISETKERRQADEADALKRAQRSFLCMTGAVVGFHREKCGKVYKQAHVKEDEDSLSSHINKNNMQSILSSDFKILKTAWKDVEAAIELESFQLVFGVLVEAFEKLREGGKDENKNDMVEIATFAVLEMMKLLQAMAAEVSQQLEEAEEGRQGNLTPREVALNTLEELFEREAFLNAPADLAKNYNAKEFSLDHLGNIVEMAHTFSTILLDEKELSRISVAKKKKKKKKKAKAKKPIEKEVSEKNKTSAEISKENEGDEVTMKDKPTDEEALQKEIEGNQDGNVEGRTKSSRDTTIENLAPDENISTRLEHEAAESNSDKNNAVEKEGLSKNGVLASKDNSEAITDGDSTKVDKAGNDEDNDFSVDFSDDELNAVIHNRGKGTVASRLQTDAEAGEPEPETEDKGKSRVEQMLEADKEVGPLPSEQFVLNKPTSRIKEMLLADKRADEQGAPKPKYVRKIDGGDVNNDASSDEGDEGDDESDNEIREIESIGIVRRYANSKAIETILTPIRIALCQASEVSGKTFPVPEGAESIGAASLAAKSACVAWSVWKVAQHRDRGCLSASFFSFSVIQLLNTALMAQAKAEVKETSVLGHVCGFAKDVTEMFFRWLSVNPLMMYDLFLYMDKGYTMTVARKVNKKYMVENVASTFRKKPGSSRKRKALGPDLDMEDSELSDEGSISGGVNDQKKIKLAEDGAKALGVREVNNRKKDAEKVFSSDDEYNSSDLDADENPLPQVTRAAEERTKAISKDDSDEEDYNSDDMEDTILTRKIRRRKVGTTPTP